MPARRPRAGSPDGDGGDEAAPKKKAAKKTSSGKPAGKKAPVKKPGGKIAGKVAKKPAGGGATLTLVGEEWTAEEKITVVVREGAALATCTPPLTEALGVESLRGLRFHRMTAGDPPVPYRRVLDLALPAAALGLANGDRVYVAKRESAVTTLYVCARDIPFDERRCFVVGLHEPIATAVPEMIAAVGKADLKGTTLVWGEGEPPAVRGTRRVIPRAKTPAQLGIPAGSEQLVYFAAEDEVDPPDVRAAKVALDVSPTPALERPPHAFAERLLKDGRVFDLASKWRLEAREAVPQPEEVYLDADDVPVPPPDEAVVDRLVAKWAELTPCRTSREEARRVVASYYGKEAALEALLAKTAFRDDEFRWLGIDPATGYRGAVMTDPAMRRRLTDTHGHTAWGDMQHYVREVRTDGTVPIGDAAVTAALALAVEMTRRLWWAPPPPTQYQVRHYPQPDTAIPRYRSAVQRRRRLLREVLADTSADMLETDLRLMLSKVAYPPPVADGEDLPAARDQLHDLQQCFGMLVAIPSYYEGLPGHLRAPLVEFITSPLRERRSLCAASGKKAASGAFQAAGAAPSPEFILEDASQIPLYLSPARRGAGSPPDLGEEASYVGVGRLPDAYRHLHASAQRDADKVLTSPLPHATRKTPFAAMAPRQLPPPPLPPKPAGVDAGRVHPPEQNPPAPQPAGVQSTSPRRSPKGDGVRADRLILFDHKGELWDFNRTPEPYAHCSAGSPTREERRAARSRSRSAPGRRERREAARREKQMLGSPGFNSSPEALLENLIPRGRNPCREANLSGVDADAAAACLLGPGVSDEEKAVRFLFDSFFCLHAPSSLHRAPGLTAAVCHSRGARRGVAATLQRLVAELCTEFRRPAVAWGGDTGTDAVFPPPAVVDYVLRTFYTAYDPLNSGKAALLAQQVCAAGTHRGAVLDEILTALCTRFAHHGAEAADWTGAYPPCFQLLHHQ